MKIQRTKNASRNVLFGSIQKVYQIIMPFIMRTLMIYYMGIEYAGLNNLFSSILQVLNLAELGIGAALVCSMYAPIAEDDTDKICALMNLYKKIFRIIGLVVLALGLILVPFLPKLIASDTPNDLNIYYLYLMYLGNTVLSYWLFAYKNSLLSAHQRTDVSSKVMILTNTVQYILQIFVLIFLRNYYLYLGSSILAQVMTNIITAIRVDKIYPEYHPRGKLDSRTVNDIKKKVQGLVTNKIGGTILRSADSIVVSAFLGLSILAVYQNYYFILSSVISILSILYQSVIAGIGNSLIVENQKKNYYDFQTMTFGISFISAVCCSCFMGLFQPFMKVWMGEDRLLSYSVIICLVVYFYIFEIDQMIGAYKDAAGIWYEDRFRPLLTALLNLGLNIILVRYIGLYGVLLSTVISLVVLGIPWLIHNVFTLLFDSEKPISYVLLLVKYAIAAMVTVTVTFYASQIVPDKGIITFPIKLFVCVICSSALFCLLFWRNEHLKRISIILQRIVKRKNR
ncbi:lipopolysaccharide biosynthesis protein [Butyrivibrio sp. XBB1001]|uniref:lipopolysaccharide biosynthesis protein n=1 Tax=Butyrivibrio sp. XBB1001 TaxID=1280682 RepID=UPI000400832B|nr:oligosaccharide flippase family protein [Butyrivibrio sp. XBB1001]